MHSSEFLNPLAINLQSQVIFSHTSIITVIPDVTYICNISGGFGIDFSYNIDDVEAGVRKVAKGLLAHGVTAFCPTLVTSPPYVYLKVDSVNSFITLSLWCKYYLIFAKSWYLLYCMNLIRNKQHSHKRDTWNMSLCTIGVRILLL